MPTTIGAINAAIPMRGFGNQRRAACSLSITDLQLRNGEMSQAVVAAGSAATLNLSRVRLKEAIQPVMPSKTRLIGKITQ
jgi:hypothetical protein